MGYIDKIKKDGVIYSIQAQGGGSSLNLTPEFFKVLWTDFSDYIWEQETAMNFIVNNSYDYNWGYSHKMYGKAYLQPVDVYTDSTMNELIGQEACCIDLTRGEATGEATYEGICYLISDMISYLNSEIEEIPPYYFYLTIDTDAETGDSRVIIYAYPFE